MQKSTDHATKQSLHCSHVVGPLRASLLWFVALTGRPAYGRAQAVGPRPLGQILAVAHAAYTNLQCIAVANAKSLQLACQRTGYNGPMVAINLTLVSQILLSIVASES